MTRRWECLMVASVWVAWGLAALLGFCWVLFAVLHFFGLLSSAADWVQAIGSIVAIVAAGAFPFVHEAAKERRAANQLRVTLFELAKRQRTLLERLINVLDEAVLDFGEQTIKPYLSRGEHLEWGPHAEVLKAIPIHQLSPVYVSVLGGMKVGTAFAQSVCEQLVQGDAWDIWGDREAEQLRQLENALLSAHLASVMLEEEVIVYG